MMSFILLLAQAATKHKLHINLMICTILNLVVIRIPGFCPELFKQSIYMQKKLLKKITF